MSAIKYKIKNHSRFMLLSSIEIVWNSYCSDSLSSETKISYHNFIENLEKDVSLPHSDIDGFEIFAICTDTD